ncbi:MAG: secretin N-terminal domain-containing protein [Methylobacter sp.]
MNNLHPAITLALTLLLVSCSLPQPTKSSTVARAFSDTAQQTRRDAQTPAAVTDALIPDFNQTLAASQNTMQQSRLNISVNEVEAREFFMGLVVDTEENMLVHPEVTGKISLELKNVTIAQVLDAVQKVYGYDYKKNDMGYIIYPATLQTKTFKINRLDLLRVGNSNTSVSSGKQSSQNNSQGNSSQQGNGNSPQGNNPLGSSPSGYGNSQYSNSSSSSVRTITDTDFWQEMKDSLNHILAIDPQATVDINQQSGIVIVRAKPMQLREIENFLSATQTQISRQVILEAKILEVTLDDSHQDGVNWESIVREGINKAPLLTGIGGAMNPATFASVFTVGAHAGDFRAFVELMDTQGKTNVLSSPRISTLNNQTAIIKVGQDEYFAYDIQSGSSSGVSGNANIITTPFPRLDVFFSGIALDVTPQIDDDENITLHIHPSISQVKEVTKNFCNPDSSVSCNIGALPMAQTTVRESDSIVKAKNGQIIVLGGLMQENDTENKQGITGLAAIPYIGNLFRINTGKTQKSELIILLKASFIGSNADWQNDINSSKQRFDKLDSQPRWK